MSVRLGMDVGNHFVGITLSNDSKSLIYITYYLQSESRSEATLLLIVHVLNKPVEQRQ